VLAALGDRATIEQLERAAAAGGEESNAAKAVQLHVRWLGTNDAAERDKILDDAQALAASNPANDPLADVLGHLSKVNVSVGQSRRIQSMLTGDLKDTRLGRDITRRAAGDKRLSALEGQSLVISGVRHDGEQFSTEQWKGRVVLVDFWATWCGPCIQELPRVKQAYADFQEKGLEVLGVSCDESGDDLAQFLINNPDMPWPQLFNPQKPGWHELCKEYGINGIPTMLLIDKKGVVRSVRAREDFEVQIPKLLEE
jgi:thiol-disulfide isomerase/thioredoxin